MKRLLSRAILLTAGMFSMSVYANPDNSCDGEQTIFDAYTVKGGKHVGVCYVYGNIRYVYGKDDNPEILINVPREKVDFSLSGNGDQSVTIPNGEYRYEIGEYLRGGPFIQVWKGNKSITEIKLDINNFENDIERYITSDSDRANANANANANDAITLNVLAKHSDNPAGRYYFWKYQLTSNVDNLTINKITVNNSRCSINEQKRTFLTKAEEQNILSRTLYGSKARLVPEGNEKARTDWDLNTGDVYYFTVSSDSDYGKCRPREVLIETNKGISTFNWKN